MGSLQLGELLTILVVVLIIFGPDKLPELARRAGTMVRKVRETSQALREEMGSDYDDTLATLHDVRKELKAVRDDVTSTATGALSSLDATARSLKQPAVPDEGQSTLPGDTAPGEVTAPDPAAAESGAQPDDPDPEPQANDSGSERTSS